METETITSQAKHIFRKENIRKVCVVGFFILFLLAIGVALTSEIEAHENTYTIEDIKKIQEREHNRREGLYHAVEVIEQEIEESIKKTEYWSEKAKTVRLKDGVATVEEVKKKR